MSQIGIGCSVNKQHNVIWKKGEKIMKENAITRITLTSVLALAAMFISGCIFQDPFWNRTDAAFSPHGSVSTGAAIHSPDGNYYVKQVEPYNYGHFGLFNQANDELIRQLDIAKYFSWNDVKGMALSPNSRFLAVMYHFSEGGRIYGIGAPSRGTTLIHYTGIDENILECVLEIKGSHKLNAYVPGTLIPVLEETKLYDEQPEYALLLSWQIADELIPKLKAKGFKGKFIVPLPHPRVV